MKSLIKRKTGTCLATSKLKSIGKKTEVLIDPGAPMLPAI